MNENEEKSVEQTNNNATEQVQAVATNGSTPSEQQTNEQANTIDVENEKLNSQLVQENQNIVSEQTVAAQQRVEAQAIEQQKAQEEAMNAINEESSKGPSTFAKVMTTLLFIGLFAFVYFLGDITEFINQKKLEKASSEIVAGRLICSSTKDTENLNVSINATFNFENKGVTGLNYTTTSTGDKIKDKEELDELYANCRKLKEEVKDYDGISVVCSSNNGVVTVKQSFNYGALDVEQVRSAYSEAGGLYPQFNYKEDINAVEGKMASSDYKCEKVSS